jgi:DEAD/DEAH box helicase domain-containing protein
MAHLYSHQAATLDLARRGRNVVVVTGTASGKTLCYHLPVLESCLLDRNACALFLFPTKALSQDQWKSLSERTAAHPHLAGRITAGVYDGDTPASQRRRIKQEANVVLSNPDMLHASILPYHPKWARFLSELRYVVIDEAHTYRGILGAHVAQVLRRLERACEHYGASPTYVATSATVANPADFVGRLIGRSVTVVSQDGAPMGSQYFALWNPAPFAHDRLGRRAATDEAVDLLVAAVEAGKQVMAFARTRQSAELIYRYAHERLAAARSPLAGKLAAYRGGYLADERRRIERDLAAGRLRGVATTNALELGIDVGSLDVAILAGYPGTVASTWQQAGRAGRRSGDSLAILIAGNDPVDQYLLRHPDYFFSLSPEEAVVDPENPYVLARHLKAASFELPLDSGDARRFGKQVDRLCEALHDSGELCRVEARYYFPGGQNPAVGISLRHMSDNTFSIVRIGPGRSGRRTKGPLESEVMANVDAISAPELVYPEAVYLHQGESFFVRELDLEGKVAYVEPCDTDYYTQAILESSVRILAPRRSADVVPAADVGYGDVEATWQTVAFKKIKFNTRETVGQGPVAIPPQSLISTGCWLVPRDELRATMKEAGFRLSDGLVGIRNVAVTALPLLAMCDARDLGGVVDARNLGRSAMILYDRYPGGLGYCEVGFRRMPELLEACLDMVCECPCADGCPSCVGLANQRPAQHSDPDLTRGYPIPDKEATACLLRLLCQSPRRTAGPQSPRDGLDALIETAGPAGGNQRGSPAGPRALP